MYSHRQIVEEAVRRRETIEFGYDGYVRVGEPHIIGKDKEGEIIVFVWQTLSGKGSAPGWRKIPLDGLTMLRPAGRSFAPKSPPPDPAKCGFVQVIAKA